MTRYRVPPHVLTANIAAEEVLLNTRTGQYHGVSGVGTDLLADLTTGVDLEDACRRISERTGHDYAGVMEDTRRFVAALLDHGLIEVVPE